ncbi:MAG TPA: VOC family protein [Ktedonosporobacter sp.]|nr:VOC family protein [Ktedonosporobacter sp.]
MSNQQIQKVKVKRLAHVGLWSTDVPAQARFYRQTLGLDPYITSESLSDEVELEDANLFFSLGGEHHVLGLFNDTRAATSNGRRPTLNTQLHHLSFEVDSDAELAALAARLKISGINPELSPRDGNLDLGDTLWFNDPDGNRIEISVTLDSSRLAAPKGRRMQPCTLQHVALRTMHLDTMVEFYTESLGFDLSDWLLRECAWLRCNNAHHTLTLMLDKPGIDHIGFNIADRAELLRWCDHLGNQQVPILWGPGRHGAGNDLFIRFADTDGIHIELSTEIQQYYDRDASTPPRIWHTRTAALNLWGPLPGWMREESHV